MNEQRKQRFEQMGIPTPSDMQGVTTQVVKNKDMLLKLEQIKRGAKKSDFKEIIKKTEGIKFKEEPAQQAVSKQKGFQIKHHVPVASFKPEGNVSEAYAIENMLFGGGTVEKEYSNQSMNERYEQPQMMEEKSAQVYPAKNLSQNPYLKNSVAAQTMTVQEERIEKFVVEKATQVATEVAKKIVKQIIIEAAKSGKEILVESEKVKKAEIVAKDKVKINGKLYKLTEIKE